MVISSGVGKKMSMACKDKKNSRQKVCYKMAVLLYSIFLAFEKKLPPKLMCPKNIDQGIMPKKRLWLYIKLFATHSGIRTFL